MTFGLNNVYGRIQICFLHIELIQRAIANRIFRLRRNRGFQALYGLFILFLGRERLSG